ncbi:Protein of unknown function, partial [Gryllus bimaculatus]
MARKRRLTLDSERKRRRNEMLPRPRPEQQLGNIASCYEGAPKMVKNTLNNESGTRRKQSIICRIDDSLILKRGVPKMVKNTSSVESSTRRRKQSIICRKDDCLKAKTEEEIKERQNLAAAAVTTKTMRTTRRLMPAGTMTWTMQTTTTTPAAATMLKTMPSADDAGGSDDGEDDASGSYDDHANGSDAVEDDASDSDDGEGDVSGSYDDDANGSDAVEDDASGSDDGEDDADAGGCADEAKAWCECRARTEALRARVWRAEQLLERVLGQLEAEEQRRPDAAAGDGGGERAGDGQRAGADVDTVVLGQPG